MRASVRLATAGLTAEPPAAAARGTCGTLTPEKKCTGNNPPGTTTLTSNCDDGDGNSEECANAAACEAACEALNLDGCCYWRNNKTPMICEFHHAVGDKVQGSNARHATTCTASTISPSPPPPSPPNDCTSIIGRKDLKDPANSAEAWYAAPDGIWCYELPASYGCEGFYTAKHSDGGVRLCLPDGSTGDGINGYCDGGELYFCSPPPTPPPPPPPPTACPTAMTLYEQNGFQWCAATFLLSRDAALARCAETGMQLVELRTTAKADAFHAWSNPQYQYWLGLMCRSGVAECSSDESLWSWNSDDAPLSCTYNGFQKKSSGDWKGGGNGEFCAHKWDPGNPDKAPWGPGVRLRLPGRVRAAAAGRCVHASRSDCVRVAVAAATVATGAARATAVPRHIDDRGDGVPQGA